ncbi:MAG: cytidine deaminase [Candidatus Eisenbacteria bacterium]
MNHDPLALVAEARAAAESSHAPYSNFPVGAALLARSGRIYRGVNVENASLGLSICAERNAIFSAVAAGDREFEAIAIATGAARPTPPCGACRQVMLEFADDLMIHLAGKGDAFETHTLTELVPHAFRSFKS